jgi:thiopeptide-type bacteriocin biosynthesis protein
LKVILSQWKTISGCFFDTKKMENFASRVMFFLKDNKIDFFYVFLFEENKNVVKIRIRNTEYNKKILNELKIKIPSICITDDYQPEVKRYGGEQNIYHIERLFCASSYITSTQLANTEIESRILLSIKLNDLLFDNLNLPEVHLKNLYSHISDSWANYSSDILNIKINNIEKLANSLKLHINQFKYDFTNYQKINNYKEYTEYITTLNYKDYNQENPVYTNGLRNFIVKLGINKPFLNVVMSLAHMNFNRLGIYPHLESTVYKMLSL